MSSVEDDPMVRGHLEALWQTWFDNDDGCPNDPDETDPPYCPTGRYQAGSIRSDGTHRDLRGHTGNYNDDLPGSPGPYWWS